MPTTHPHCVGREFKFPLHSRARDRDANTVQISDDREKKQKPEYPMAITHDRGDYFTRTWKL